MDKFITTGTGGIPFNWDDLRFMDDAIRDGFKGLHNHLIDSTLTNDGFIFDKIDLTGTPPTIDATNSWTFPESYAVLNGEILLIPEKTLASSFSFGDWYILELDDSFTGTTPGLKTFQDASSVETYQLRRGKLTLKASASFVSGTDVPVLFGSLGPEWQYINNGRYSYRTREKLGIETLQTLAEGNETRSLANETNVSLINSAWTSLATGSIEAKVLYNAISTAQASGDTAILGMDSANSRIKYKKIGKTMFVDFLLKDVEVPTYATSPVSSILLDLGFITGVNNILAFDTVGKATESVYNETLSGSLSIQNHSLSTKKILMNIQAPHGDSNASFNREYTFGTTPTIAVQATADTDRLTIWTLKGQFTCEIN